MLTVCVVGITYAMAVAGGVLVGLAIKMGGQTPPPSGSC